MDANEIQARAAITAALIQSRTIALDLGQLVSGKSPKPLADLRIAVDKIYESMTTLSVA